MKVASRCKVFPISFFSNLYYTDIQIQCAKLRLAPNMPCISLVIIIGASLSEPHINGTAMREFYIIYYGTSVTRNYNIPSDLYGHKREIFYCAFSCLGYRPYIRRSNLANCKSNLHSFLYCIDQAL